MTPRRTRETPTPERRGVAGGLGGFIRSRQRSALGLPEVVALGAAALLLVSAVASYFLLLRPQRARLAALQAEQGQLNRQLEAARSEGAVGETAQASVERILASLQRFEGEHLSANAPDSTTAVIKELNGLIQRHGLRISGGLTFTPFEVQAAAGRSPQRAVGGAVKPLQNVFPGIGVSLSVEGAYPGLRHFIRDVEADERFVVINAVELEGVTDTTARFAPPVDGALTPGGEPVVVPAPSGRGTAVALRLDMAAYFRRAGVAAAEGADAAAPAAR